MFEYIRYVDGITDTQLLPHYRSFSWHLKSIFQIRKKLAALNREEEKIAEEARKKAETAAEEDAKQKAEEEKMKRDLQERRNIAIAAAGEF